MFYDRGDLKTFIHVVHLLQILEELPSLPVRDILQKLLEMEGGQGQPSSLMGELMMGVYMISLCLFEEMYQNIFTGFVILTFLFVSNKLSSFYYPHSP